MPPRGARSCERCAIAATPLLGPVLAARSAEVTLSAASQFVSGTFVVRDARGLRAQFCEHHQREFGSGVRWSTSGKGGRNARTVDPPGLPARSGSTADHVETPDGHGLVPEPIPVSVRRTRLALVDPF